MTSDNTNQYRYFVSYVHAQGFGNIEVNQDQPMDRFDFVTSAAKVIEQRLGYQVAILDFQLLSGPGSQAHIHEALANLHRRLRDAVDAAETAVDDDRVDAQTLAEVLTNHIRSTRAAVGGLLRSSNPSSNSSHTLV